jgi:hypothetical protein
MVGKQTKLRMRGLPRFIAATFVVAFLYIVLQTMWVTLTGFLVQQSWTPAQVLVGNLDEAARQVDERSAPRESLLTPTHREAAFELGFYLGYAAVALGPMASSNDVREQLQRRLRPFSEKARAHAVLLGAGEVTPFPAQTAVQYLRLTAAIDEDQTGLAGRIESSMTPRHKHIFLLGAHVGVTAAQVDIASVQAEPPWPVPPLSIARHATLAGLPREAWNPLLKLETGRPAGEVAKTYRDAAGTLARALTAAR